MASFIVSYDLIKNKDYPELFEAIQKYNCVHILESVWIVNSSSDSKTIRDNLKTCMDSDDKLFVAKLTGQSAWKNLSKEASDWINNNT